MKWISMVETFDGQRHRDYLQAEKHLDKLYGDELTKLATDLAKLDGKYKKFSEFLDDSANQARMIRLTVIKKDMELVKEDD